MTSKPADALKLKLNTIGAEVLDTDEETYDLFSHDLPQSSLGMIDAKCSELSIEVAGNVYEIRQSLGLLTSSNAEGTTGAALWKISPLIAEWLADQQNVLWSNDILHSKATVVELGCGVSGLIGCVMARQVSTYLLTDQRSVMKLLRENISTNEPVQPKPKAKGNTLLARNASSHSSSGLHALELNWETDDVSQLNEVLPLYQAIDLILVCDCVFNDFLLKPLVNVCEDICMRSEDKSTVLLIAQQLRSDEVFSSFLTILLEKFCVWRLADASLSDTLQSSSGFAVHAALLR